MMKIFNLTVYGNDNGNPVEGLGGFEDVKKKLERAFPEMIWESSATGMVYSKYPGMKFKVVFRDGKVPFIIALVYLNRRNYHLTRLSEACRKEGWILSLKPRFKHYKKLNEVPADFEFTGEAKENLLRLVELHRHIEPLISRIQDLKREIGSDARGGVQILDRIVEYHGGPETYIGSDFDVIYELLNLPDEVEKKFLGPSQRDCREETCFAEVLPSELVVGDTEVVIDIATVPAAGADGITHPEYARRAFVEAERKVSERYGYKGKDMEPPLAARCRELVMLESIVGSMEYSLAPIEHILSSYVWDFTVKAGDRIVFFYPLVSGWKSVGHFLHGLGYESPDIDEILKLNSSPEESHTPAMVSTTWLFSSKKPAIVIEPIPPEPIPEATSKDGYPRALSITQALQEAKAMAGILHPKA